MKRYLALVLAALLVAVSVSYALAEDAFSLYGQALSAGRPILADITISSLLEGDEGEADNSLLLSIWQKELEKDRVYGLAAQMAGETVFDYEEKIADGLLYLSGGLYGDSVMALTMDEFADYYAERYIRLIKQDLAGDISPEYDDYLDAVGLAAIRELIFSSISGWQTFWDVYAQFAADFLQIDMGQAAAKLDAAILEWLKEPQTEQVFVYSPFHDAAVSRATYVFSPGQIAQLSAALVDILLDSGAIRAAMGLGDGLYESMRDIIRSSIQSEVVAELAEMGDITAAALFDGAGGLVSLSVDMDGENMLVLDIRSFLDGKHARLLLKEPGEAVAAEFECLLADGAFCFKAKADAEELLIRYQKEEKQLSPRVAQTVYTAQIQAYEDNSLMEEMTLTGDVFTTALRGDDFRIEGDLILSALVDGAVKDLAGIRIQARTAEDIKTADLAGAVAFGQLSQDEKDAWADAVTARTEKAIKWLLSLEPQDVEVEAPGEEAAEKTEQALQIAFEPGTLAGADEKTQQAYQDLLNALTLTFQASPDGTQTRIQALLDGETAVDYQTAIQDGSMYLSTSLWGADVVGVSLREYTDMIAQTLGIYTDIKFDAASMGMIESAFAPAFGQNGFHFPEEDAIIGLVEALWEEMAWVRGTFIVPGQGDAAQKGTLTLDGKTLAAAAQKARISREWDDVSAAWLDSVQAQFARMPDGDTFRMISLNDASGLPIQVIYEFLSEGTPRYRFELCPGRISGQDVMFAGYAVDGETETEVLRFKKAGNDLFLRAGMNGAVTFSLTEKSSLILSEYELSAQLLDADEVPLKTLYGEWLKSGNRASLKLFLGEKQADTYVGTVYLNPVPAAPIPLIDTEAALHPLSFSFAEQMAWSDQMLEKFDDAKTALLLMVPRSVFSLALDYMQ